MFSSTSVQHVSRQVDPTRRVSILVLCPILQKSSKNPVNLNSDKMTVMDFNWIFSKTRKSNPENNWIPVTLWIGQTSTLGVKSWKNPDYSITYTIFFNLVPLYSSHLRTWKSNFFSTHGILPGTVPNLQIQKCTELMLASSSVDHTLRDCTHPHAPGVECVDQHH